MQILKGNGIDWSERRLCMTQNVKVQLNRAETSSVKTGRGVRQGCCLSPFFNVYSECLAKEAVGGFGDLKIGQIINTEICR
jgi:hypothetical protein